MYIIRLIQGNQIYSFANDGKILLLDSINVPKMFIYKSEASNYITGYIDAILETGNAFSFTYDFQDIKRAE